MERLTCKFSGENVLRGMCTFDRESGTEPDDCVTCSEICEGFKGECGLLDCPIQKGFDRLATYENTGITPEQLHDLDRMYRDLATEYGKYKKAEEQGLLLKLPCKVGTTVWTFTDDYEETVDFVVGKIEIRFDKDNMPYFFIDNMDFDLDCFGKNVFLTQKEAEEALRKKVKE